MKKQFLILLLGLFSFCAIASPPVDEKKDFRTERSIQVDYQSVDVVAIAPIDFVLRSWQGETHSLFNKAVIDIEKEPTISLESSYRWRTSVSNFNYKTAIKESNHPLILPGIKERFLRC